MPHSPGPWCFAWRGPHLWMFQIKSDSDPSLVRTVFDTEDLASFPITLADARLMKASPDLLDVCKKIAELRRRWRSDDDTDTIDSIEYMDGIDALDLDAVIAKAEDPA